MSSWEPPCPVVAIVGPTASGKSRLGVELASQLERAEIVCSDSMTIYRGMDIGTAKPELDWRLRVPHHLIDLAWPWEEYSVAQFQAAARQALDEIAKRGGCAIVVGGTGLYVRAALDGLNFPGRWPEIANALWKRAEGGELDKLYAELQELDPQAASRILPGNTRRIVRALEVTLGSGRPFSSYGPGLTSYPQLRVVMWGLSVDVAELDRRIAARVAAQLDRGWLEEARRLLDGPPLSRTAAQALGYRELFDHLEGRLGLDDAYEKIVARTKALSRRQRSWFRRDPRVAWIPDTTNPAALAQATLERWNELGWDR